MPYAAVNITGVENCSNREKEATGLCASLFFGGALMPSYRSPNEMMIDNAPKIKAVSAVLLLVLCFFGLVVLGFNLHDFMARPLPCHDRNAVFGHAKMLSQNFNERLVGCPVHCLSPQKDDQALRRDLYEVALFGIGFDKNGDFHGRTKFFTIDG